MLTSITRLKWSQVQSVAQLYIKNIILIDDSTYGGSINLLSVRTVYIHILGTEPVKSV